MQICGEVNDLPGVPAQDWRTIAYTVQQLFAVRKLRLLFYPETHLHMPGY